MYYTSEYTNFCASEPPYTDTIYYKDGNKTIAVIHIDKDWNMTGDVLDPFDLPINISEPTWGPLDQVQCERMLMKDMPKPNRKDIMQEYNMGNAIDYAKLVYCTRLINMINSYWVAWSENDKAEDYHPRFNPDILRERDSYSIKLDPEPEDNEPPTPYIDIWDTSKFEPVNKQASDLDTFTISNEPFRSIYSKE